MPRLPSLATVLLLLPLASGLAAAAEQPAAARGFFTRASIGTQGVGLDLGYTFSRYYKLRLRGAWLEYERTDNWRNITVHSKLEASSTGLLLDTHPWGRKFRISTGLNYAPTTLTAKSNLLQPKRIYTLGGSDYRAVNSPGWVSGSYSWNSLQPYLGIGWDWRTTSGVSLSLDLGINLMNQGKLRVNASSNIEQKPIGTPASAWRPFNTALLRDSLQSESREFFRFAERLHTYPVIQLGAGIAF